MHTHIFQIHGPIEGLALTKFKLGPDSLHGPRHWKKVSKNGHLLSQQPGVDGLVLQLFAVLHDCCRNDEGTDPAHGARAAEFVTKIRIEHLSSLTDEQFDKLHHACRHHSGKSTHDDPTIGACFDADRLDLTRCGIIPDPSLMSTGMGKRMAIELREAR